MAIGSVHHVAWPVRVAVAAVLGSSFVLPAMAAAAQSESERDEELSEVQVTGTRIQLPNVTAANPITTVTGEEMRALGIVNVADALTMLVPQNLSTYTDFAVSDTRGTSMDGADRTQYFIGNTIANLRGLDPGFGTRTLTMIDGRRVVSTSSQADVVDLNIIPSNLLQRMDVVTGGASASYGSGAMAGVVNLVLNNRMQGVNLDLDYGVNEAGDGGSPHAALSAGFPMFGGRAHALLGVEWQKTSPIQNCAEARAWCAESRTLFQNGGGFFDQSTDVLTGQMPGYENAPRNFQMANVRYSQFSPNGVIYMTGQPFATTGFRFTADGSDVEEYALGYRGGNGSGDVMNGDGPVATSGISMRSANQRRTGFANFEYNFTERTTGYVQANYAKTEGSNRNNYTTSTNCVRFNSAGIAAIPGATAASGDTIVFPASAEFAGTPWAVANFRAALGITASPTGPFGGSNFVAPYWYQSSGTVIPGIPQSAAPPTFNFGGRAVGVWESFVGGSNTFWRLVSITMLDDFEDPGTPATMPQMGRNAYAFLNNLSPEALEQVQRGAFTPAGSFTSSSTGPGPSYLIGGSPCAGHAPIRKVWSDEFRRFSENESETMRAVLGVRGRFGRDWRWDAYYQYGQTDTFSTQNNAATTIRQMFAMDAVIDDRPGSPTYGTPICRVQRDGVPVLDTSGRPLSDPAAITALAQGCAPLNILGSSLAYSNAAAFPGYDVTYNAAQLQQDAINYAFVENSSAGKTMLQTLSVTTSGTLWQGLGAGPMTGAFGFEAREDEVDNSGSLGNYYERFDITGGWSDKFGGRTRTLEGYTELNLPLISGQPGINLWSINAGVRYSSINNKGGAGTTGASLTQNIANWKFSTVFEPFDWIRLRLTRSRDLRAAGYRDLFLNQSAPGGPDFLNGPNPWRERTAESTENQQERYGLNQVGNPDLKPETSNTLTLGLVLSPGGWAQGMRLSADYYDIKVKDGIFVSYAGSNPIDACWDGSGNQLPGTFENGAPDPSIPGINGQFDENHPSCQEIVFAELLNEAGDPIPGTRNLEDILAYNGQRPQNNLPYQRRGIDLSWSYMFPLSRAFESLPGSMSLTVRGQRALESSGSENTIGFDFVSDVQLTYDLVGQIRSSRFIPGVSASPKWTGNIIASYMLGNLTTSLSARYIGGAVLDKTWGDEPGSPYYQDEEGRFLVGSVDNNFVKPYFNFSLNGSYNLRVANLKQFQVFGSINNLFDKDPPYSGGYLSGVNAQYHDTMGRAYRMGVRMRF